MGAWIAAKLANGAVRIAVVIAALLAPVFFVAWIWTWVDLHGIALPAPNFWPFHGRIELVHGAIADRDAAILDRDNAIRDKGLALHDRDVARSNAEKLKKGLGVCNAGVDQAQKDAADWQEKARKAVAGADAARHALDRNREALSRVPVGAEQCPLFDALVGAALQ